MSAERQDVERLFGICEKYLPEQPWFYDEDELTDRSEKFLASELVREKLFRLTGDELFYTSTVVIDKVRRGSAAEEGPQAPAAHRRATIVVERDSHKAIGDRRQGRAHQAHRHGNPRRASRSWPTPEVFAELWVEGAFGLGRRLPFHKRGLRALVRLRMGSAPPPTRVSHRTGSMLHRYDWSEVEPDLGGLHLATTGASRCVAKGAKRPSSNFRPVLLPLQPLQINYGGDAEIRTLKGAEWMGGHVMPTGDALLSGYYLNELLLRLLARRRARTRRCSTPTACVVRCSPATPAAPRPPPQRGALRAFELLLLREVGLLPAARRADRSDARVARSRHAATRWSPRPACARRPTTRPPGRRRLATAAGRTRRPAPSHGHAWLVAT